jgi:hypothetical protein
MMEVTMTDQTQTVSDTDEMDAHVIAVIGACGGDPKLAIRALLVEQEILEQRIARLASALSFGYVRGRTGINPRHSGWRADPLRRSDHMQHGRSRRSRSMMTGDIVGKLLETLRATRHLLTRALAHIPIGYAEY